MKRFILNLSYDGAFFKGWQKQKGERTVQGELETALSAIAKKKIAVIGAGRTDTGVHALNQFAHFDFHINMNPTQIRLALLSKLPKDIYIKNVFPVQNNFSARYDAYAREYIYLITNKKTPFNRFYKTYYLKPLSYEKIFPYLDIFIGKYDFSSFAKKNPQYTNYICDVTDFELKKNKFDFVFRIKANRFLHNMVRRLIGTILTAVEKDISPNKIRDILLNGEKEKIVHTAPPTGLYLANVFYNLDFYHSEDIFSNPTTHIF